MELAKATRAPRFLPALRRVVAAGRCARPLALGPIKPGTRTGRPDCLGDAVALPSVCTSSMRADRVRINQDSPYGASKYFPWQSAQMPWLKCAPLSDARYS